MANTFKALSRGAATTSASTVYTVPTTAPVPTTTLVNNILVANTASVAATFTILFNDVAIAAASSVPGNDSIILDIKQILPEGNTIKTFASAVTVNFHISGLEIS
jgi:hypothetical protein